MDNLFIKAYKDSYCVYLLDIESYITVFIYVLSDTRSIKLKIKLGDGKPCKPVVPVMFTDVLHEVVYKCPEITSYCTWPIIVSDNNVISGLCSTARYIIKSSSSSERVKLLGFREACLMACSESSIWTRFCEIDIINTVTDFWTKIENYFDQNKLTLPANACRFEFHMNQPVRLHNVYKVARIKNNDSSIESSTPIEDLKLNHCFGEGPFMTLADAILFPCFKVFFELCPINVVEEKIPKIVNWYNLMTNQLLQTDTRLVIDLKPLVYKVNEVVQPEFIKYSLYTADPNRYRPEKRIFTKQKDIETSLEAVESLNVKNLFLPYGHEIDFDWSEIPLNANPIGGALPEKRAGRKCQQLENLAKAVVKIAEDKPYKIVDFCSGSGHLGILMAYLLPNSTVILVENKEKSLERAKERIKLLDLKNVKIVQSNLDYFIGNFDVGVALHACGVATDLVVQKCISNNAHFVVCPCCYGGIRDCHLLKYPRSDSFKSLDLEYKNYLSLAHAADQTHDSDNAKTEQGFLCMDVVDTDRKLYAESCGYNVHLGKLQPVSCTKKNNLLVGIFKET